MTDPRYDIYFAGEILDGHDEADVRQKLARMFKADAATLEQLFSGKPRMVKRNCDKAVALRYKQALEQAGARPIVRPAPGSATQPAGKDTDASKAPSAAPTMAERVAALAGDATTDTAPSESAPPSPPTATPTGDAGLSLAPLGPLPVKVNLAPPPPETHHLSLASAGETIPTLPDQRPQLDPDTSAIELSPDGTDFSDCAPPPSPPQALELDLDLAPTGADMLESEYRERDDTPPPDTSSLSLE